MRPPSLINPALNPFSLNNDPLATRIVFSLKTILVAFLILVNPSDTIITSEGEVKRHFAKDGSYLFMAAHYQDIEASYQVYLQTGELDFLKQAALKGQKDAIWDWYQYLAASYSLVHQRNLNRHSNKKPNSNSDNSQHLDHYSDIKIPQVQLANTRQIDLDFWFERAVSIKHPQALMLRANQLLNEQKFEQLGVFLNSDAVRTILTPKTAQGAKSFRNNDVTQSFTHIKQIVELFNDPEVIYQTSLNKVNWIDQEAPDKPLSCSSPVLLLAGNHAQANKLLNLSTALDSLVARYPNLQGNPYCYTKPIIEPRLLAICQNDNLMRASCDQQALSFILNQYETSLSEQKYTIVMVASGLANVRENVMFLSEEAQTNLLLHELAHWSGLVDEYPLRKNQQAIVCQGEIPYWPGKNVLIAKHSISQQSLEFTFKQTLWPTNTCQGTAYKAYKTQAAPSVMEYFDAPLTQDYLHMIFSD